MQYSKKYRKLNGFTLIESMLGIMVIGLVSGSIMLGITTVEKKLFKIRLKEQAFEVLRNYTNFLGSRISAGNMPDNIVDSGKDVVIYKHEDKNNIVKDVYTAKIYFDKDVKLTPIRKKIVGIIELSKYVTPKSFIFLNEPNGLRRQYSDCSEFIS